MDAIRSISPVARAIGVITAVAILATSVTFAALSDTATLTNNTITSATADLNVWDGGAWAGTATGFDVNDLVPGVISTPYAFYMQNNSSFAMDIAVAVPVAPSTVGVADFSDVSVNFHDEDQDIIVSTDLAALLDGSVSLGQLAANTQGSNSVTQPGNFFITVELDPAGVSGTQADVGAFNLVFTGSQVVTP